MAKPKRGLGSDPLDRVVPIQNQRGTRELQEAPDNNRKRATFHIDIELMDLVRDAWHALSGPPLHLSLADLAEEALAREVARLQELYNDGEPFPPRDKRPRTGRWRSLGVATKENEG